jgi:DNA replication protein DnaC
LNACPDNRCDGSGFLYDDDGRTARPCSCRPARMARKRAAAVAGRLPKRFRGVSFDRPPVSDMARQPGLSATVGAVRRYCETIDQQLDAGNGLWLMGGPGTGKTTLAMLASKEAIKRGHSVAIYSVPRLLAEIRDTYDAGAGQRSYADFFQDLVTVDLLHLDDLGAEKQTEWVLEQLYALVNERYEQERSIVVTSNVTEAGELEDQIGKRTISRLIEMTTQVPLFGDDLRQRWDSSHAASA